jgi:hypothetical protein
MDYVQLVDTLNTAFGKDLSSAEVGNILQACREYEGNNAQNEHLRLMTSSMVLAKLSDLNSDANLLASRALTLADALLKKVKK